MSILTIVARYLHSIIKKNRNILYNHETNLLCHLNPEKPDVPLNKNDAFQKVQKRRVQEKR